MKLFPNSNFTRHHLITHTINKVNLFNKIPHGTDVNALYYFFSQFYSMKLEVLFCLTYNKLLLHVEMKVFIEMCIVICI